MKHKYTIVCKDCLSASSSNLGSIFDPDQLHCWKCGSKNMRKITDKLKENNND